MIGMTWKEVTGRFGDWKKVRDKQRKASLRALSKFGAFVRKRSRHSVRKRKGISQPGQPPSSHAPHLLREGIVFVVEPATQNVVIGPVKLNKPSPGILKALEHGGKTLIMGRGRDKGKLFPATVEPRPFMKPAFDEEIKRAPYLWQNGLRP